MNRPRSQRRTYKSLLAYRRAHGLTQRQAAASFGVSQACWERIENQKNRPHKEFAQRLVQVGIPLEVVMGIAS